MQQSHAKVSCLEKCCTQLCVCSLQLLNVVDFIVSSFLIFMGINLYESTHKAENNINNNQSIVTHWFPICSIVLGSILILEVFLSCCATTTRGCRFLATLSAYLSILVAIFSLVLGIASLIDQDKVFDYLNNNATNDLNLSEEEIILIENNYQQLVYFVFTVTFIQLLRYYISLAFQSSQNLIDNEYDMLLAEDHINYATTGIEIKELNKSHRHEKYDHLKAYYRDKYNQFDTTNDLQRQYEKDDALDLKYSIPDQHARITNTNKNSNNTYHSSSSGSNNTKSGGGIDGKSVSQSRIGEGGGGRRTLHTNDTDPVIAVLIP